MVGGPLTALMNKLNKQQKKHILPFLSELISIENIIQIAEIKTVYIWELAVKVIICRLGLVLSYSKFAISFSTLWSYSPSW